MIENEKTIKIGNRLYYRVDKTLYEIVIHTVENAKETLEDAFVRFVANEIIVKETENKNGEETR